MKSELTRIERNLALAKRVAHGKGIPLAQLLAKWLEERISKENKNG